MLLQVAATRADSVRTALDRVFAERAYRWETREDPFGPLRRLWLVVTEALSRLRDENPQAYRVVLWLLVALLVAILAHAAWVAVRTVRGGSRRGERELAGPVAAVRDAAWYGNEALRLATAGEYVAAMQADFLRLVLELDARRVMAFHPSKTPSEYVREAALSEDGRRALRGLVREMYAYAFARRPCDRVEYDRWRARAVADRYATTH